MNRVTIKSISIVIALVVGGFIAYLDSRNFRYIWVVSVVLLGILIMKVKYRHGSRFGVLFSGFKESGYEFTQTEKDIGIIILSFMASPFIFMLIMSLYGTIAL